MNCKWQEQAGQFQCVHCQTVRNIKVLRSCPTLLKNMPIALKPMGLGDRTEIFLSRLGITQEFYKAAKEAIGLAPECNCTERKDALNEWGRKAKDWWETFRDEYDRP